MTTSVRFAEDGAHFCISEAEYDALDSASRRSFKVPLSTQPINKVVRMLRGNLLSRARQAATFGGTILFFPKSGTEGEELSSDALPSVIKEPIDRSVKDVGRLIIEVYSPNKEDDAVSVPVQALEYTSRGYDWAGHVVGEHSESLLHDGRIVPTISPGLLAEKPMGAEAALAYRGLRLYGDPRNSREDGVEIVRLGQIEFERQIYGLYDVQVKIL